MYISNMMKRIAENMAEVSRELELNGEEITGAAVYEVYRLEMELLAQEVGLQGHIPTLSLYLQLIEEFLGEEVANALAYSELINLLKVIRFMKLRRLVF